MKRRSECVLLATCAAVLGLALSGPADTLTTMDGRTLSGQIDRTSTGYTVHTDAGAVEVADANVKVISHDTAGRKSGVHKPGDSKTVQTLQAQAHAAFAAGYFDVARDEFGDAAKVDPNNPVTARGLGMAYLRLERPVLAVAELEAAYKAMPTDRETLIVLSTALIQGHNPMRAVKFVKAYMEKPSPAVDEDCLNALGAALSQADAIAAKQQLFKDASALYVRANAKLEAGRTGEKRWGSLWMPAAEVDKKTADRKAAEKAVADARPKIIEDTNRIAAAEKEMAFYSGTLGDNNRSRAKAAAERKRDEAQADLTAAEKELEDANNAVAALDSPSFPLLESLDSSPVQAAADADHTAVAAAETPANRDPDQAPDKHPAEKPASDKQGTAKPVPAAEAPLKPVVANARPVKPNTADEQPAGPVTRYAAAFAVAPDLIVAPASVVSGAATVHVDVAVGPTLNGTVVRVDADAGLALIRVDGAKFTAMNIADRAADKPTTCLAFPNVDLFNPILETIAVANATSGQTDHARLAIPPRLPGAPLVQGNAVVGLELANRDTDPAEVPVLTADAIRKFVGSDAAPTADGKDAVVQVTAEK